MRRLDRLRRRFERHILIFIPLYDIRQVLIILARLCHYLSSDYRLICSNSKDLHDSNFKMNEVIISIIMHRSKTSVYIILSDFFVRVVEVMVAIVSFHYASGLIQLIYWTCGRCANIA